MTTKFSSRGDATRDALLQAALEIFGRDGFHAASTRAIARAAGVNQALIGFHFGGKQGLYLAVFEHVAGQIRARVQPLMRSMTEQLDAEPDQRVVGSDRLHHYLPLISQVTDALVSMFTAEESRSWARLIMREQQDPTEAFELLYSNGLGPMLSVFTELVARTQGSSADDRQTRLLVFTIIGQALIFRAASAAAAKHLGKQAISPDDTAAIQAVVRRNVAAILEAEAGS